ncbi:MAG: hypothetical protein C0595_13680 [Marinilabiliales bacterium]|nr:MAG: hypothetical protein C0595_13680 [Marinilabiliales bacterium]
MKTKILLLAIAILGSGLIYSQPANNDDNSTKCEKKVMRKIQRKMSLIPVKDYLEEGEKTKLVVKCTINEDYIVEVAELGGKDEDLKKVVIETLKNHPVKCDDMTIGSSFTFVMKFVLMPA